MNQDLKDAIREDQDAWAVMLWDGHPNFSKNLVGWALMINSKQFITEPLSDYAKKKSKYAVEFWVKSKYRGKGHAHKLMEAVKKIENYPIVFPHSEASGEFFGSYNVLVPKYYRGWYKHKRKKM